MHWARDRTKGERFPIEYLVRKLSSDTARAYGMTDRGELRPGTLADINVIDFEKLKLHRPEAVHDLPAGGKRLIQARRRLSLHGEIGAVTFENGEFTGVRCPVMACAKRRKGCARIL